MKNKIKKANWRALYQKFLLSPSNRDSKEGGIDIECL